MKKLFMLLVFLLFIGCDFQEGGPTASISEKEIRTGTKGLVVTFQESMPPNEIDEGDVFPIAVDLKNQGLFPTT